QRTWEMTQRRVLLTPDRGMRQNVCRTWGLLLFCYPRGREHRIQASSATITYRIIGEEGHEELVDRVRAFDINRYVVETMGGSDLFTISSSERRTTRYPQRLNLSVRNFRFRCHQSSCRRRR